MALVAEFRAERGRVGDFLAWRRSLRGALRLWACPQNPQAGREPAWARNEQLCLIGIEVNVLKWSKIDIVLLYCLT